MSISLGNAIKSVGADPQCKKKIIIGGFVYLIVMIAIMFFDAKSVGLRIAAISAYLIFGAILSGFFVSSANKQINSDSNALAEWSEKNLLVQGLKFIFSYIVYSFVVGLLFTLISTVLILILSIILGLIYFVINLVFPLNLNINLISTLLTIIFVTFITVFCLYFMQYLCAGMICYYKNRKFHDLMSLKKQFKIVAENQHTSWSLVGKFILYTLLLVLITVILSITIIGFLALPFVIFAAYLVSINLYSQYAKQIDIGRYLG